MVKNAKIILRGLTLLTGGTLAVLALASTPQLGRPLSDKEASTMKGGCEGKNSYKCAGANCASTDLYSLGSLGDYKANCTQIVCGGSTAGTGCDKCYTDSCLTSCGG
jgi:hypothetical protein